MLGSFFKPSVQTLLTGLCAALVLSGCGSDQSQTELTKVTAGFFKQAGSNLVQKTSRTVAAKPSEGAPKTDPNAIIGNALAATTGPIALVVRVESNAVLAMNPVGRNGNFTTWGSAAGQGITYQNGVLSNTRGLGEDLMSSRIDTAVTSIVGRRETSYTREHFYLGDLGQSTRLVLDCTLTRVKSERVAIGEINADAVVMKESCAQDSIAFDNYYWVDGKGRVLKSSQWVGQRIGSLAIQNLRL